MIKLLLFPIFLSIITITAAQNIYVLDTDGEPIRTDRQYYIVPGNTDVAGGFTLAGRNGSCPLSIAQSPQVGDSGIPVTFTRVSQDIVTINYDEDVNIAFSTSTTTCEAFSTVWRLAEADEVFSRAYVSTGGYTGVSGNQASLNFWFRIERHMEVYRLAFCPTVCNDCNPTCGLLNVDIVEDQRWLSLFRYDESVLPVQFRKA
ncbi:kunitz trypsin inhibitor 5-like [Dioscorea cayenensis subsp. rotundata]|uniref:Kunitz trypsin inhibitor 5-like n=1 Tax=Dioscorea cayennensis subsp. rotundata TaxID=55577 RepID=A0AB40CSL7_DIOCR|nr:kunitz trypsin inhibitor 5-like [Dioscorea cayenensis subsp. rotundata]